MKSWHRLFAAGLVLLIIPSLAHGWWRWGGFHHRYYRAAYYGGAYYGGYGYYPVAYAPAYAATYGVYPAACGVSLPVATAPTYATPQAAPPSQSNEPPMAATKKGPTITESRSLGGNYASMDDKTGPLRVGFWNISGKDVNLKVNGETHLVPRNRTLNLRLDRSFIWQAGTNDAKQEQIAESQTTHEVILR
ncbi:MAG: hypothetical protein FJ271_01130 [Planctomycetes bacterium]|nr:hypothetical protein [Planctomycetota bacterium]